MLVSTLTCQECMNTSSRYEEFFDLSLPTYVDRMEELVATKRNAPKSNTRSKVERASKRSTEQPMVTTDDTDEDVDHNGNDVATESSFNHLDDSPIISNDKKDGMFYQGWAIEYHWNLICLFWLDNESPMSTAPVNVDHHQLSESFDNLDLKEKKYKIKRTPFNSIEACLNNFTECEIMDENNKVGCEHCAVNTKATKQYLIFRTAEYTHFALETLWIRRSR